MADSFKRFFNEVFTNVSAYAPQLDPLKVGSFSFKEDTSFVKVKASFQDIDIGGLSMIKFTKMNFDERKLKATAKATIDHLKVAGKYRLDGTAVYVLPLKGNGDVTVLADTVTLTISASVTSLDILSAKVAVDGFDLNTDNIKVNLTNLEGGEDLGTVLNQIFNILGKRIFKFVEPYIADAFEHQLQNVIDSELKSVQPQLTSMTELNPQSTIAKAFYRPVYELKSADPGNLNGLFDQVIANVNHILSKGYDPWKVDHDARTSFSKSLVWPLPDISGGAKFDDIEMYGLSHLMRTGNVTLSASPRPTINLNVGVRGSIRGGGDWEAWLSPIDISGSGSISISNISIAATIELVNKKGIIQNIGFAQAPSISVHVPGLSALSWISSRFIDAIINVLSPWLNSIVAPRIHIIMQNELNKVDIPI